MKKLSAGCLALALLFALAACAQGGQSESSSQSGEAQPLEEAHAARLHTLAEELTGLMDDGREEDALGMMNTVMAEAMKGKIASTWAQLAAAYGTFEQTETWEGSVAGEHSALEMTLVFERGTLIQRTIFDADDLVAGLFFRPGAVAQSTAAGGMREENVTVDAGEGFPLAGKVTLPEGEITAAVVLVHGSGPQNMDSSLHENHPFADIAQGLANHGIAVLRYDKRTLTYGVGMDAENLTILQETVNDAVAAVNLLKEYEGVDPDKVFLLGHSMGGGLLAYANSLGANVAGYVVVAGTTRPLWDLIAEQNLTLAAELREAGDEQNAAAAEALVAGELAKAERLPSLSDVEAKKEENRVFTLSAYYLKSFLPGLPLPLHLADGKPVLVIQGGRDRQVTTLDYELWQQGLAGHPAATFKLYPGLNHLLGEYKGGEVPLSELVDTEYKAITPVAPELIDDIAAWMLNLG